MDEEIVRTTHSPRVPRVQEETLQAIFASALGHLEEAQRTIGRLEAERDQARSRLAEIEADGTPGPRRTQSEPPAAGGWAISAATVLLLVVLPLFLAVILTRAGLHILSDAGATGIGFKDIVEVLVVGLVATILVQSWDGWRRTKQRPPDHS